MLGSLATGLGRWHYNASPDAASKRDGRIDLLRGFCVFVMIIDHVGGESSWLYVFTGGNRFIVSAAEGFLLLSGFSMGMVHHVVIRTKGIRAMIGKVLGRAWVLYSLTVVLTIAFAAVSDALGDPYTELQTPAKGKIDFAMSVITFHRTYSLTDILVLYTLLILMAGPVLWLIARGYTGAVLAASITTWTVAQLWPERIPRAWQITDGGFPFSAWQLMFVTGLVVGYHRERLASFLRPRPLVAFGIGCTLVLVIVQLITKLVIAPDASAIDVHELLFDKNDARIGRIIALLGAASFFYAGATVVWVPLRRVTGWLLLPMGRRALFAYGAQLFVVAFFASDLMAPVRLDRENAFFQAAAVGIVWLLCLLYPRVEQRVREMRPTVAAALVVLFVASGCGGAAAAPSPTPTPIPSLTSAPPATTPGAPLGSPSPRAIGKGRVEKSAFHSNALNRNMQYWIYLPGGYDASPTTRYATAYLLHGGGGFISEWADYGVFDSADRLMGTGAIPPFIIVLPEGDQEYWVDHVIDKRTGANGEKWGTYTAKDVVPAIDAKYRTIPTRSARAIGGLSMGGHGAMQLSMNFPGIWGAIGAHSPSLRPEGDAPTYLGFGADFAARDPLSLIRARPDVARQYTWWIDVGDLDPWRVQSAAIHDQLTQLGIAHFWGPNVGGHELSYWYAHMDDYVTFYARALCPNATSCP